MKVKIEIECDNAAFGDAPGFEVARILRNLADKVENQLDDCTAMDYNGNKVAKLTVTGKRR